LAKAIYIYLREFSVCGGAQAKSVPFSMLPYFFLLDKFLEN